jgi:hypothetical protein
MKMLLRKQCTRLFYCLLHCKSLENVATHPVGIINMQLVQSKACQLVAEGACASHVIHKSNITAGCACGRTDDNVRTVEAASQRRADAYVIWMIKEAYSSLTRGVSEHDAAVGPRWRTAQLIFILVPCSDCEGQAGIGSDILWLH